MFFLKVNFGNNKVVNFLLIIMIYLRVYKCFILKFIFNRSLFLGYKIFFNFMIYNELV